VHFQTAMLQMEATEIFEKNGSHWKCGDIITQTVNQSIKNLLWWHSVVPHN